jgi:hypothetical protein
VWWMRVFAGVFEEMRIFDVVFDGEFVVETW